MNDKLLWKFCIVGVIGVSALAFTPLVIPMGNYHPMLLGLPFTLWMGIVVAGILVLLTYLGTKVHPGNRKEGQDD